MGVKYGQESAYIQERRKWEQEPVMIDAQWIAPQIIDGVKRAGYMDGTYVQPLSREEGGRGMRVHQAYPKMLYRAERADGGPRVDVLGGSGTLIVHSEQEQANMESRGWYDGQEAAIAAIGAQDLEFAKLAAERNHETRRMSGNARAEVERHEDAASGHLPSIPQTPIKKRGRPFRVAPVKESPNG